MLNDLVSRFLLVFLSIGVILQETTIYRRREKLRATENGLDLRGAYEATLGRIKGQGGEKARLGMAVLMWISHSRRPLRVDEICHATAIRIGSNDLNNDDIPTISTLLNCSQGLATIEKGTSTIRLIHFTLQEYLLTHPHLFDRAHSTMAETCLTYLNFPRFKNLAASSSQFLPRTPFLEYSSLHWGTHMRIEVSGRAKVFALQLLDQFDGHISAKFVYTPIWLEDLGVDSIPGVIPGCKGFSGLHCASYFGIAEVANTLIKMNRWDVNELDGMSGATPLIWAARYGNEEVVKLLLQIQGIQPGRREGTSGRTALSWAAGNGHEGVVRLLLGSPFVNPGSLGRWWGEAVRVVGVLFGWRYVNPDSPSHNGQTPLSWAAENGHEGIVKLPLERGDVKPDTRNSYYSETPLSLAAGNGHEGIVRLLLGRKDVSPNSTRNPGETPLLWAAAKGREGIVKLLLAREDVHLDAPDTDYGQTPLSWATENGHERIVKLLLERKDVNPNSSSKSGETSLTPAAKNGHSGIVKPGIVKLLLERKDVNPNSSSDSGETPLTLAAKNGHDRVVELLQACIPDVSSN